MGCSRVLQVIVLVTASMFRATEPLLINFYVAHINAAPGQTQQLHLVVVYEEF